jgi:hypothetical protein
VFPDHQATVVDARLHPPDVVAHDEEDVGLLIGRCLLGGCLRLWWFLCLRLRAARQHGQASEDQPGSKSAENAPKSGEHDRAPLSWGPFEIARCISFS